mmetsp:Transcript_21750/g.72033  ORF Transcript_21750/g.72033 Transcript_21750/m.72033 type:complete len:612 (-) Transcript_21750:1242-3077(-)
MRLLLLLSAAAPAMRALAGGSRVRRLAAAGALRPLRRADACGMSAAAAAAPAEVEQTNFVRNIIKADLGSGKHSSIVTRFPPEPNGYLHIGHAKSICVNFGLGEEFGGRTYMRLDDTNPEKEEREYVDAILADVRWLGFDWADRLTHASDYFEQFHAYAEQLVREGLAYVDELSAEQMREYRGTLTSPGRDSPFRDRPVEESVSLFRAMTAGEMEDGAAVVRLKIDMASPNMNLRDPTIYRIKRSATHPQTGDKWKVYPMYDFAHSLTDALEGITHSLCTTEFEAHRPLYDWIVANTPGVPCTPRQIEFSRLNLQYCVLSKRKLIQLVREGHVSGWDDPRMPTLVGLRRRGVPPEAIRLFVDRTGVSKALNNIDYSVLEDCVRASLDSKAARVMAVLDPLRVTVTSWPEGEVEMLEGAVHPKRPELGMRQVPFSRSLLIERSDFDEFANKKYFRFKGVGSKVRLRFGYVLQLDQIVRGEDGEAVELRCSHVPGTAMGGKMPDGEKVKGIIHWVSEPHAARATVRLYDRLFTAPEPGAGHEDGDFLRDLNPHSLDERLECALEPAAAEYGAGEQVQFERTGYFAVDPDSTPGGLVFNRVVTLRDTWAKVADK